MHAIRSLAILGALALSTPALAGTVYNVDASHSRVGFSVTHMMVSTVRGEFGTFTGTVEWDPKNVGATKVQGTVGIASINTREAKRDEHLKSPDFFDVASFPEAKFVSTGVKNVKKDSFDLIGDLTIRGVTKSVTVQVKTVSPEFKDPWGNVKAGTRATATINRKDFGITWSAALDGGGVVVSDEVGIDIDLELVKKQG
jgi:polyisoprenoid-binding protein YceI